MWPAINSYANAKYNTTQIAEYTAFQFGNTHIPAELTTWCDQRHGRDRPLSLILCGPSRLGKTEWARSLGRHMYFNTDFDLALWDETAEYIIFDDISNNDYFFKWKGLIGAQKTVTLTDKYRAKKTVQWGKPCIWLCNEIPHGISANAWVTKNCTVCYLENALFCASCPHDNVRDASVVSWPDSQLEYI